MGMQFLIETRTMKFFQVGVLALAAIACAEPEADAKADPAYFYGNYYGYPSYYSGYGYRSYASPYWGGYYNRGYGYWKRDADSQPEAVAEANAEADPAFFYRNYFYNPYYNSHSWGMDQSSRHMDMNHKHTEMNHRQMDINHRQIDINQRQMDMTSRQQMNNMGMNNMGMNQMQSMNNMGMNQMHMNNMGMNNMQMNNRNMMQYNMNRNYAYALPWGYNLNYQGSRFFKREAEAEADPAYFYGNFYNGAYYRPYYYRPYGYNWGYSGYRRYGGYWW